MLTGSAPLAELVPDRATMPSFDTGSLTLPGAEVLQLLTELRIGGRERSLPSGLHPTNPPSAVFQVWRCPESPWGPFTLAQARVACRSGLRPRGLVQGCVVDVPAAAEALRSRWGFPARVGQVAYRRGYDLVTASVSVDGEVLVELEGRDPDPLGVDDVAYTTTLTLAETPRGSRLVQVDTDVVATRAERLRPHVAAFGVGTWMHSSVEPSFPVSASVALADVTLRPLRFVCLPDELAFTGTEVLEQR